MTSKEIERYRNSSEEVNGIEFYRVNSDSCGNPRYVVHFWAFISDEERSNNDLDVLQLYRIAKKPCEKYWVLCLSCKMVWRGICRDNLFFAKYGGINKRHEE